MKYVLVTGAYGGMGRAAAMALRDAGYGVFALDIREPASEAGIVPIRADLTSESDVAEAFERIKKVTDELFAIVHFAGIYLLDSLVEMSGEEFERAFAINVFGAARVNRIMRPLLARGSRIVITTSELAPLDPLPFTGLYAVTKSALDKYAYSLRMELQLSGIDVVVLRPGAVRTDMLGASTAALDRFVEKTELYSCNANRFKGIVDSVEARNVPPERIAKSVVKILKVRRPRLTYSINRNPLLLLLNVLPRRMQTWIIRMILK